MLLRAIIAPDMAGKKGIGLLTALPSSNQTGSEKLTSQSRTRGSIGVRDGDRMLLQERIELGDALMKITEGKKAAI